jgi:hypothetical protein
MKVLEGQDSCQETCTFSHVPQFASYHRDLARGQNEKIGLCDGKIAYLRKKTESHLHLSILHLFPVTLPTRGREGHPSQLLLQAIMLFD